MTRATTPRPARPPRLLLAAALVACGVSVAFAADWPTFKPGSWKYDRVIEKKGAAPQRISKTQCVDPTADQKAQRDMLKQVGCELTPPTHTGTTYRYSSACQIQGKTTTSQSVLDAKSAEAFTLTVETATTNGMFREVLKAKRVGDCPK